MLEQEMMTRQSDLGKLGQDRSAFLSHTRHELRTPLNHIIGYTEMLLEEVEEGGPASFEQWLYPILAAAKSLLTSISHEVEAGRHQAELDQWCLAVRTPINAIIGYTEILIEDAHSTGQENYLSDLERVSLASRRLLNLVDAFKVALANY